MITGPIPAQSPDTKPGDYFVTALDGRRVAYLLGPFVNDHMKALSLVDATRHKAEEIDPRACWYSFGTCRLPNESGKVGKLNSLIAIT